MKRYLLLRQHHDKRANSGSTYASYREKLTESQKVRLFRVTAAFACVGPVSLIEVALLYFYLFRQIEQVTSSLNLAVP